jgi:sodium-dependent dicarboxylate transporter 2/3/5
MGIAFAASIGGLGTLVGSPTNAIAAGIIERATGLHISFLMWAMYGVPLVLVAIPLTWWILMKVQRVQPTDFDPAKALAGIGTAGEWSIAEKRLVPLIAAVVAAWVAIPFLIPFLPKDSLTDGAASWGFLLPSGTGPNAIAWATGHIALPRMLKAGFLIDLAGVPLMVGMVWLIAAVMG